MVESLGMAYLIGTDEAGYGPNLGPLVIAATVWQVPEALLTCDLYDLFQGVISANRVSPPSESRFAVADSKRLFSSHDPLTGLEQGVYAAWATLGSLPDKWPMVWSQLCPGAEDSLSKTPWYRDYDIAVPIDAERHRLLKLSDSLAHQQDRCGAVLTAMRATAIFAEDFNRWLAGVGSKGTVLSEATLELVRDMMATIDGGPILVQCDKHGGRNRYAGMLQHIFPDCLVRTVAESRAQSRYRWGSGSDRVEIHFTARGESQLPSALASMVAKYLRELAMLAFNAFWQKQLPNIKPTAGYPVDARRFKRQIAACQAQLGIMDETLWRQR